MQQLEQLNKVTNDLDLHKMKYTIQEILDSDEISKTSEYKYIIKLILDNDATLEEAENYLRENLPNKYKDSNFKKILLAYDTAKFNDNAYSQKLQ